MSFEKWKVELQNMRASLKVIFSQNKVKLKFGNAKGEVVMSKQLCSM